jgi:hypothetical protein
MSDPGEATMDGPACYRGRSTGIYKTFRPGDVMFKPDWIFIHNGTCECEGKSADQCQEPGDDN